MNDWTSFLYFTAAIVMIGLGGSCLGVYLRRKSTGRRAALAQELQQLADKALEARDDPNDPARFVP
jgi:hypothetical protein